MNVKSIAIASFAKFIFGGRVFNRLLGIIKRQQDTNLTGQEKRAAAFKEVKVIGLEVTDWVINLGIELAVAWMRQNERK